jgi:hypothetical protein
LAFSGAYDLGVLDDDRYRSFSALLEASRLATCALAGPSVARVAPPAISFEPEIRDVVCVFTCKVIEPMPVGQLFGFIQRLFPVRPPIGHGLSRLGWRPQSWFDRFSEEVYYLAGNAELRSFIDEAFETFGHPFLVVSSEELRENLVRVVSLWRSRSVLRCKTGFCSEPPWTHSNSEYIDLVAVPRGPSVDPSLTYERVPAAA